MRGYLFKDTITGHEAYDISNEDYATLLNICGKFSAVLSLVMVEKIEFLSLLEPFRIPKDANIKFTHDYYGTNRSEIRYYRVCDEVIKIFLNNCKSLFEYIDNKGYTNANDLTFYRNDGSVLFTCVVHEGIAFLLPKNNEDLSQIYNTGNWHKVDIEKLTSDNGYSFVVRTIRGRFRD